MADGGGAVADLRGTDGILAALDAVEPVLVVLLADVEFHVAVLKLGFAQGFRVTLQHAAVHMDLALVPDERGAGALGGAFAEDRDAVGVFVGDGEAVGGLEAFLLIEVPGGADLDRPAGVHAKTPLRNVQMMRAPVGHLSFSLSAIFEKVVIFKSAPGGNRTPNLLGRNQLLYPLSYGRRVSILLYCPQPPVIPS